nr:MAG TPA: hypothetical protein [Caudoviricetes sp.]
MNHAFFRNVSHEVIGSNPIFSFKRNVAQLDRESIAQKITPQSTSSISLSLSLDCGGYHYRHHYHRSAV